MRRPAKPAIRFLIGITLAGLAVCLAFGFYHSMSKPLPHGLGVASTPRPVAADAVRFLFDLTWKKEGQRVCEQTIYDRAIALIQGAEDLIVADLFLFNDHLGKESSAYRRLSHDIAQALIDKKRQRPDIAIVVISDPVNEAYGGAPCRPLDALRAAGVSVVITDLSQLRDSNPAYSAPWRLLVRPWGAAQGGRLPHPFSAAAGDVGLRSWLALLNFKANHRKTLVTDAPAKTGGRELASLVMSANPHDGSSAHSNVAIEVRGELGLDLLRSEQAVLDFSSSPISLFDRLPAYAQKKNPDTSTADEHHLAPLLSVQLLTEGKIRESLLTHLASTASGDTIDIAMFYLADRRVIDALETAATRGVAIRLVLDPNRDAFGYAKDGIPNRPVAAELHALSNVRIRWYATHGEQFHSKLVVIHRAGNATSLWAGSANLTRRNLDDFNLETDLLLTGPSSAVPLAEATAYFEHIWTNSGASYTLPYEAFAETSALKRWKYRFQEWSGLGTF